jgi:hypothetical protein
MLRMKLAGFESRLYGPQKVLLTQIGFLRYRGISLMSQPIADRRCQPMAFML